MLAQVSPQFKRNLNRIIPFGVIWLVLGWIFLLNDILVTGNQNPTPEAAVTITLPVFIFASLAVTSVGLLFGLIELVVFEKRFRKYSFLRKVTVKFFIYLFSLLLIILVFFPIATSIELATSILDDRVLDRTINFFQSMVFVNTMFQLSFHLILSLLYASISENLGHQVLVNFFTGRYHRPKKEQRIFMFLDMKSSTTIAETLGHEHYFSLLQEYYEIMSTPIIDTLGEVYQYIGDEVVVTWTADKGLRNDNCINCFRLIREELKSKADVFQERFGLVPDFKAGLHIGEVTTGEIGALKKEVIFTGDVMNTTARVQSLCNEYQTDLIITDDLLKALDQTGGWNHEFIGEIKLKGKTQTKKLYSVRFG